MAQRTAASLEKLDALIALMKTLPGDGKLHHVIEETEALRRAVAAFHMEAIRFRMYAVDRAFKNDLHAPEAVPLFEDVRKALEDAGFHTRSHTAP